ncbi:MAG TPA: hypothetical protein VK658_23330 [Chryseolinea sp.]|nr:hypothetical protein [Chryseolinea sp.]
MKDELEDFIRKNRRSFDDRELPRDAWTNIRANLAFQTPSLWNSVAIWRAAAILFMVTTGYFLVSMTLTRQGHAKEQLASAVTLDEFRDVEQFYTEQISEKVKLISNFKRADGLNGFTHDFHQLEAMYNVLNEQMKSNPSEKVKDALVLNLLVRIDLLNQQLHKLERENKTEKNDGGRSA